MSQRFTRKQLEQRNTQEDAAIIIDNVVYDVTHFLEDHPGGVDVLLDNVGKDASKCFHDVGHSEDAKLWRKEFQIGEVVDEDRWEVLSPVSGEEETEQHMTLRSLLDVWVPPLLLAGLAVLMYIYLLS